MNLATVTVWMFAASLAALPCAAQPPSRSHVEFNGFGTLGVVHSSEDRADFVNSSRQPDGAGHSSDFAFDVDSRLGIQATANPDGRVAAVIQVVAEQDEDDTYTPSIEWANLKYDITPESSIRAGRTVLPIFMVSDSRKVGYANPWLRPPTELYNLVPVTSNDGVDVLYQARAGPALTTLQAYLGQADFPTPELGRFEARNTYGASGGVLVGDIEIRAGYVHSHVTSEAVNSLFAAFRRFGPRGSAIADRFDLDDKQIEVFTVGLRYDPERWFVQSEWARSRSPSFLGTERAWYLTGGFRAGPVTPFASVGQSRRDDRSEGAGLDVSRLPPGARPEAAALNSMLDGFIRPNDFDTFTVGVRWDFRRNADLKLQVDHFRLEDRSQGRLANVQPEFEPGGSFNVFSVAVEFVF